MKRQTPIARAMSDWNGLVAERRYRMAVSAWNEIITELRVDRGMLLGNAQYSEMTGVERVKALDAIDDSIKTAKEWVSYYAHERDKVQGGIRNIFKTRKIRRMTDEELGEV